MIELAISGVAGFGGGVLGFFFSRNSYATLQFIKERRLERDHEHEATDWNWP